MRGFNLIKIFFLLALLTLNSVLANSAPVDDKNLEKTINDEKIYYPEQKKSDDLLYYAQKKSSEVEKVELKKEEKIKVENIKPAVNIVVNEKKQQNRFFKRETKNIEVCDIKTDRIISQSSIKISAVYPEDIEKATNTFPGYRGPNQLVIYKRDFGRTTGTNEFGKEAVVEDNVVVKLTGANSTIPRNGFVISGHGRGKKMD